MAYFDPPGVLTVCRGHTGADVIAGKQYSMGECDQFFSDDMRKAVREVDHCLPGLPVPVLAAFGDAAFNLGSKVACDPAKSTAARYLKAGRYDMACNELPKWNKATVAGVKVELPGLTTRRGVERGVCLTWSQNANA